MRCKYQWYLDSPYRYLALDTTVRWFGVRLGEHLMHPYSCHFQARIIDRRPMLEGRGWIYTLQLDCDNSIIDEISWMNIVPVGMESVALKKIGILLAFHEDHEGPKFRKDLIRYV